MKQTIILNNNTITLRTKYRQLNKKGKALILILITLLITGIVYTYSKTPYTYNQCMQDYYGYNPTYQEQQCSYLNK